MTGSYKIALLIAGLLCALVIGYYAMPSGEEVRVDADDTASEPADDESTSEPRSLVRNSESSRGAGDEMTPFNEPTTSPDDTAGDATPPSEDPGLASPYDRSDDEGTSADADTDADDRDNDQPVLPVARNGNSVQSNPFDTMDVAEESADDEQADANDDDDDADDAGASGRTLTLSERSSASESESDAEDEEASASSSNTAQPQTYTVQSGDTLSSIASDLYGEERHWADIARANPRVDPIRLRVGQELRLPDRETIQQRSGSDEDELETPPGTLTHVVRPGETLSTIAQQHYNDSSRWRVIFNANRDLLGSDPDRVSAGDELTIPPLPRN